MVPTAQFVVYYISSNGDIISGGVQISVSGLNNFVRIVCAIIILQLIEMICPKVTIKTSADEKQPGENVDITISTKPLSQVCLLGIDQSVALLKTGKIFNYTLYTHEITNSILFIFQATIFKILTFTLNSVYILRLVVVVRLAMVVVVVVPFLYSFPDPLCQMIMQLQKKRHQLMWQQMKQNHARNALFGFHHMVVAGKISQ